MRCELANELLKLDEALVPCENESTYPIPLSEKEKSEGKKNQLLLPKVSTKEYFNTAERVLHEQIEGHPMTLKQSGFFDTKK